MSSLHAIGYASCLVFGLTVGSAASARERSGAEIYHDICSSCHQHGAFDAPKLDDFSAWQPRLAKGKKGLYQSAVNGVGDNMPARDQYESRLSDREVKNAVNYMLKQTRQYRTDTRLLASGCQ